MLPFDPFLSPDSQVPEEECRLCKSWRFLLLLAVLLSAPEGPIGEATGLMNVLMAPQLSVKPNCSNTGSYKAQNGVSSFIFSILATSPLRDCFYLDIFGSLAVFKMWVSSLDIILLYYFNSLSVLFQKPCCFHFWCTCSPSTLSLKIVFCYCHYLEVCRPSLFTQLIFVIVVVSIAWERSSASTDLMNMLYSVLLVYLKCTFPYLILESAWALLGVWHSVDLN